MEGLARIAERAHLGADAGLLRVRRDELGDLAQEVAEVVAAVLLQLAGDQIERLDVVRALVDREDLRVAAVLLDGMVGDVAGAAVGLDRELGDAERLVGAVRLHDRREEIDLTVMVDRLRLVGLRKRVREVEVERQLHRQRPHALDLRLHLEKHAADVGVLDDRNARRIRVLEVLGRRALQPLAGVGERVQVRRRRDRQPLYADRDAGAVHHAEHLPHPHVRLSADEDAVAAAVLAEAQDGRRRRADAELVLDRRGDDVVRLPERAVVVHPDLRHDEEREPLRARRRPLDACEHEVDDVLGQVVVAGRDPALRAGDLVDVAGDVLGMCLRRADVGAGVRLREAHRPREASVHHRR